MTTEATPAPLGALRVDITSLKREPEVPKRFAHRFEAPEDLRLESIDVSVDDFTTDLTLDLVGSKIKVDGTVVIDWHGPCRRCLEPASGQIIAPIDELFEFDPVDGETYGREEDFVDLRPMVTDQILLSLPLAPLCDESCEGFNADVDGDDVVVDHLDEAADADQAQSKDPRWSALDELSFE